MKLNVMRLSDEYFNHRDIRGQAEETEMDAMVTDLSTNDNQ